MQKEQEQSFFAAIAAAFLQLEGQNLNVLSST